MVSAEFQLLGTWVLNAVDYVAQRAGYHKNGTVADLGNDLAVSSQVTIFIPIRVDPVN